MTVEIKIIDPHTTPAHELLAVANLLTALAARTSVIVPSATPSRARDVTTQTVELKVDAEQLHETIRDAAKKWGVEQIHSDDNPAAGVDSKEVFAGGANPQDVFGKTEDPATATTPDPRDVFGKPAAGNVAGVASSLNGATPQTTAPAGNAPGIELDGDGLPWDARIHAETKSKIKAGTWKRKRGVDEAIVAQVEAELRAVMGNAPVAASPVAPAQASPTAVTPPPVVPSAPNVTPPPPPPPASGAPVSTVAPPPVSEPASPGTVANAPAPTITFPQLCAKITNAINGGTLTQARLGEVLASHKLQGLPTLAAFQHLVAPVAVDLGFA